MKKNSPQILYLLGAGRSGTTMLTTVLNNHPQIFAVGEMHQFLDYVRDNKDCSCGADLSDCSFWSPILSQLDTHHLSKKETVTFSNDLEWHTHIPKHLIGKPNKEYSHLVNAIFDAIDSEVDASWLLDSSKYISRYLLLRKNKHLTVKGIYMVRDVRGVIYSFGKNVQTPKKPFSAILYYTIINFWGQLVSFFDSQVIRIRYEDFVKNPEAVLEKLEAHVLGHVTSRHKLEDQSFEIPHIIAGNRLRSQKKLVIKQDVAWKENISRGKQLFYYLLALPTMLFNQYKP